MAKTLLLMRHAKSDWGDETLADFDRPLNRRGKRDAPRMGRLLRERDEVPDLILSSSAVRARKTATKVAEACGYTRGIELHEDLYEAAPLTSIGVLGESGGEARRVLLIGHNPGLESLLSLLAGQDECLPTAAVARIVLPIDAWSDLTPRTRGSLKNLWRPRELD